MKILKFAIFLSLILNVNQLFAAKKKSIKITENSSEISQNISKNGFADIAEKLLPAVVNISTMQVKTQNIDVSFLNDLPQGSAFDDLKERLKKSPTVIQNQTIQTSIGSGFIISQDGFIATNNHVIDGAKEIIVGLNEGKKYKAKIIGKDKKTDLALLKIDAEKPLPFVEFGDSSKARIGDWVLVIGNPYGLGGSLSVGIVSANNRSVNQGENFIQTDAAINKGNSGGPMFNIKGEVIGVNTALFSPSGGSVGIGFANPSSTAKTIIEELKEKGEIERGWIGVFVQNINDDFAKSLSLKQRKGVFVIEITIDSPAYKAGLVQGDVILKFNGIEISDMKELPKNISKTKVGQKISLLILRNNKEKTIEIEVGKMPENNVKKISDNI
jgi:serine protease Do